ncbi:hypothetical protein [Candidatus Tisiphia endosymbiont of Sialis lutaria]|uniref:hypothetical protein n=1 Tax=Candidatus Tisiphia endosymbiont of Sialis lutaria TaxID=2029164 RepID=UPI00312CB7E3
MSYFLQPKRVKYRITLVIVGSLLEVTTSPTSPELTIHNSLRFFQNRLPQSVFLVVDLPISW